MTELCRFEYSRELLNSKCDFGFIGVFPKKCSDEIISRILRSAQLSAENCLDEFVGTKKIIYDFSGLHKCNKIIPDSRFDVELSWKFAIDMIVKDLKKTFPDSIINSSIQEIDHIPDKVTIHRLIIVDWN